MSVEGPNSVGISRQSARYVMALGLVLLSVTVAGAALGGVTAAESQSSPVKISNWTDLQAIDDSQATLSDDYVLVNDLNKSTAGYNAVVLNQTATEFTEDVFFDSGESRVNLTRTPVDKLLSNGAGLNLTVVDSANGTIERENTSSSAFGDVSYTTSTERFVGFSQIGPFFEPFSGSFDGQGNTIRDLLIDRPTDNGVGLFGVSEGTIEQVTVANATITGSSTVGGLVGSSFQGTVSTSSASGNVSGSGSVGGLVGKNRRGTVNNSSASGAVNGSDDVGGLVGANGGTVSNSSASGNVSGSEDVGGLVGANGGTVSNASASGAVTGSTNAGGLVGSSFQGTVSNASASGAVTGSTNAGGLVGDNQDGTVSTSSASGAVTGSSRVGGLVGDNSFDGTVSTSSASGAVTGSTNAGGLVGDNSFGTVSTSSASGAVNGSFDSLRVGGLVGDNSGGTVSNASASGAVTGSNRVGGLVGDNDLDGTVSNASASGAVTGSNRVGGLVGDNPKGTVSTSSASGAVTGSTNVGGLVGRSRGTVSTSSASGNVSGSGSVGGLVGDNSGGTVSTSSASGVVTGSNTVGGLVGTNDGTVSNSSASGAVNGSDFVGGLVGDNFGTVSTSSASGAVTGTGEFGGVGGLVGDNNFGGTVSNSSASGAVTGSDNVGGLVGTGGTVNESFATGAVTGSGNVGGLVGSGGSVNGSYWDIQATGQSQSAGGTGLNTSQMQGASAAQNMGALDFTNTWRVVTDPPGYPELQDPSDGPDPSLTAAFNVTPEDPTAGEQLTLDADPSTPESDIEGYNWTLGDGTTATGKQVTHTYTDSGQFTVELTVQNSTETDTATETVSVSASSSPVEISDWTDLEYIRNNLDADYVLVNDLNKSTAGYNAVVLNQTATNFTEEVNFDEGESRVSLTRTPVDRVLSNDEGLNLTVVDSANGTIERENNNSFSNVDVSYTTPTERFVGFSPIGSFSEPFTGSFDGQGNTIRDLLIDRPTDDDIGLFGFSGGTIEQVTVANATITGSGAVGGLVGTNSDGSVSNSSASGAVTGTGDLGLVGGLVGANSGTVSNSAASGAVNGSGFAVGGLVGGNSGPVSNSSASGAVTGPGNVGGLVGGNTVVGGTVNESFATGAVTSSGNAGGLVGSGGSVNGSYWDIQATGQSQSAGGTGLNTSQMQGASAVQNMGALDFNSTWRAVTNPPGYPELRGLPGGPDPSLTAVFTITPENPTAGEQLTLDAAPSTPESDIEGYNWTLGDGTTATGKQVTHTYTDSGQFTVELTVQGGTETDTASETVTVNEPSSFDVTITSVNSTVTAGETIAASYEVTNTGGVQATQDIEFSVNGSVESTEAGVTLNGSETVSGQFSYDTVAGDTPAVNATVSSADDTAGANVTVLAPAVFTVDIVETTMPVEGETLNVTVGIENTGAVEGTQTVTLDVGALGSDSTAVTLDGGGSTTLTLGVGTDAGDAGAYTATVSSADDSASANVTVLTPAEFVVDIVETNTPVEGESLNVTATIENTGDVEDTQMITLDVGPLGTDSTAVTLGGGASTSVTLSVGTDAGDAGEYTTTVSSADDAASANVTVLTPAEFLVGIVETNTPVEGEQLNVTATIENTGDAEDTQTVTLDVGPLGTGSTTVTLGGGTSTNVTLSVGTGAGDAGEYTATVASADDAASANVTVLAPAEFVVSIVETTTPVEGEQLNVTATIENTGDVEDTQTIDLNAGALGTDSTVVTLAGGASTNLTLSVGTGAGDAGEYTATVSSADDSASANVTVLAPAEFVVDIVETNIPVEGESLNVTATVENTGDVEDTQSIDLSVGPLGSDSTAVTLAGGASTNVTLSVGTTSGDAGAYTATVSSANATTSANVTVLTPAQFVVSNLTAPAETTVGASITVSAIVTNIGGADGSQTVAFRFDGQTVVNRNVSLTPDANTTVTFTATVPNQTGTFEHGVFTADDNQTAEITVVDPEPPTVTLSTLRVAGQGANATVLAGSYNVSVTVSHDGGPGGVVPVELTVGPTTITETITLNASETTTVTFENATGDLSPGSYDVTVSAGNASLTGELTLSVPVGDNPDPSTDTDDDGLLEDTDGDGEFTIFDVQTFFIEFQSDPVKTNSVLFNFDGSEDGTVTIFDVQALFLELAG